MSNYLWASREAREADPGAVGLGQLALPILLESILRSTVGMVNVAFLSRVSDNIVGAVSVSNQYITICQIFATAVATGTIVCINQAIGMKNHEKVDRLASIAVAANLILGLLFSLVFFFLSGPLLSIMQLEQSSIAAANRYMRIAGGLMFIQCVEIVLSNICRSMGYTKAPLAINLAANLINIVGCYIVVFRPFPIPVDLIDGIALASVFSRIGGLIMAVVLISRTNVRISPRNLRPFPKEEFGLALSIGIPGGLNRLAYSLSQLVTTSIISMTGAIMVTTKVYVTNLVQYIALVGMAFAQSSTIMVGYRVGAGKYDEARTICSLVTRIALISNAIFSLLLIAMRGPLMRIFTTNEMILHIAYNLILIDFAVEIGRALNNTLSGALQAVGDVCYQLIVNQASGWLVAVGGAYVLGILFGWGLYGVWAAFALDEITRGLILLHRWRSGSWQQGAEARLKILLGKGAANAAE